LFLLVRVERAGRVKPSSSGIISIATESAEEALVLASNLREFADWIEQSTESPDCVRNGKEKENMT
jgi:hypothetical protein